MSTYVHYVITYNRIKYIIYNNSNNMYILFIAIKVTLARKYNRVFVRIIKGYIA